MFGLGNGPNGNLGAFTLLIFCFLVLIFFILPPILGVSYYVVYASSSSPNSKLNTELKCC